MRSYSRKYVLYQRKARIYKREIVIMKKRWYDYVKQRLFMITIYTVKEKLFLCKREVYDLIKKLR